MGLGTGWAQFAARVGAVGDALPSDDAGHDGEGIAHLAEQVVCWLSWSVAHADPYRPMFQRQNDLITKWGGPNVDNVYRHARVAPGLRYRIRGRMHSCEQFVLALRAGFMHDEQWGTLFEITATDLGIGEGDDFEILLGGDTSDALTIPDGVATVSIREYYFDWRPLEPAVFTIECLDEPPPDHAPRVGDQLDKAAVAVERSLPYWAGYMRDHRAAQTDNAFGPPQRLAKGLDAAAYRFCFWNLGPDDALAIESMVPDAPYWSLQLYNLNWFDSLDFAGRITSLNHRQAVIDGEGRVRVTLAHHDPGTTNWLDTEGRAEGLLTFRWFWSPDDVTPSTSVIPFADACCTDVSPLQRAAVIAARRAHVAWRFRT